MLLPIVIVISLSGYRLHALMAAHPHLFDRVLGSLLMLIGISLLITQVVAG